MRLIVTADWHLNNFKEFSRVITVSFNGMEFVEDSNGILMNSRLFYILKGVSDIHKYALENNIHDILFAGDMFHRRGIIDVSVFNAISVVLFSFKMDGITIHAIAGNHDQVDSSIFPQSALQSLNQTIHVIEKPEVFSIHQGSEGITVNAIPFCKDNSVVRECSNNKADILLAHVGINGAIIGSTSRITKDELSLEYLYPDNYKFIALGHYHRPQMLRKNVFYTGCPCQNDFGDETGTPNKFVVIDTDTLQTRFVDLNLPLFLTASSATNLKSFNPEYNHVRVRTHESLPEEYQGLVKVEFQKEYVQEHRSEISLSNSTKETVSLYFKENSQEDFPDYALKLGLSFLEG